MAKELELQLGDTVKGFYQGVEFTGVITACHGNGDISIDFPEGGHVPTVFGRRRVDGIMARYYEVLDLELVSRPETMPEWDYSATAGVRWIVGFKKTT